MGSISLQWDTDSGVCLRISELWFHEGVSLLVYVTLFYTMDVAGLFNTTYWNGCCDILSMQLWIKVIKYSLTWRIRAGDQYVPSIHSWDSGPWKVLHVPLFFFLSVVVFNISVQCLRHWTIKSISFFSVSLSMLFLL